VPPMPKNSLSNAGPSNASLSDTELLQRLSALYNEAFVATVAKELADARQLVKAGLAEESIVVAQIHARFTYRMHDLGEFMKGLLQRYTQWHNRVHERSGRLWEDRFKSVIVEDGVAARTMAAYIDLNPVRAGMVTDPAEYRWSSYGEAIGGGAKGNGKTARAGLVRAWGAHKGMLADAALWSGQVARAYRKMLMAHAVEKISESIGPDGAMLRKTTRKGIPKEAYQELTPEERASKQERDGYIPLARMLRHRIRYFTDGAVIGSRVFVDEAFAQSRHRFGPKRSSGARKMRGKASAASPHLYSLRDLRKGIG
ncbi:MAG: hypothetical protein NTU84_11130, partial [Verrucomicrobia bacterium]|nr:hypothetical protein [Verrucomicrobiota bacterium]